MTPPRLAPAVRETSDRVRIFRAMGDRKRLVLLEALMSGPVKWGEAHAAFARTAPRELDLSTFSYHVNILIDAGLARRSWDDDRHATYSLTPRGRDILRGLSALGLGGDAPRKESE